MDARGRPFGWQPHDATLACYGVGPCPCAAMRITLLFVCGVLFPDTTRLTCLQEWGLGLVTQVAGMPRSNAGRWCIASYSDP